jgi:hypothetical protein
MEAEEYREAKDLKLISQTFCGWCLLKKAITKQLSAGLTEERQSKKQLSQNNYQLD